MCWHGYRLSMIEWHPRAVCIRKTSLQLKDGDQVFQFTSHKFAQMILLLKQSWTVKNFYIKIFTDLSVVEKTEPLCYNILHGSPHLSNASLRYLQRNTESVTKEKKRERYKYSVRGSSLHLVHGDSFHGLWRESL